MSDPPARDLAMYDKGYSDGLKDGHTAALIALDEVQAACNDPKWMFAGFCASGAVSRVRKAIVDWYNERTA